MARPLVPDDLFDRVLRARSHVEDAYDEPLTVARLARTAHLSPFHFLRVYASAFGETPGHALARVRLSRARALLARGVSVTEACFAVGFSSLGSFSSRFRREFGITPRAFQRAARMVFADARREQLVTVYVPFCFATHFAPDDDKIAIVAEEVRRKGACCSGSRARRRAHDARREPMIRRMSHVTVYVLDQERARSFYTEKLDFEIKADVTMGTFRWLTVGPKGQADLELILMPVRTGPMMPEDATAKLQSLIQEGHIGVGVFETTDCRKTYDELSARGVVFKGEPAERPYGVVEAMFADDSGNWFSLTERRR